jgi:hypothetical protein
VIGSNDLTVFFEDVIDDTTGKPVIASISLAMIKGLAPLYEGEYDRRMGWMDGLIDE